MQLARFKAFSILKKINNLVNELKTQKHPLYF